MTSQTVRLPTPDLVSALGNFDLDPIAPDFRQWDSARENHTDGYGMPWDGKRVWLNPRAQTISKISTRRWVDRLAKHGNGIALLTVETDTQHWQAILAPRACDERSVGVLFLARPLQLFTRSPHVGAGQWIPRCSPSEKPMALVAYGNGNVNSLEASGLAGVLIRP